MVCVRKKSQQAHHNSNCKTDVRDTDQDETVNVNQSRTQLGKSHIWIGRDHSTAGHRFV